MTDEEMGVFLAPNEPPETRAKLVASLNADQRAMFEHMNQLCADIFLWENGLGPKPTNAILCGTNEIREGRGIKLRRRRRG